MVSQARLFIYLSWPSQQKEVFLSLFHIWGCWGYEVPACPRPEMKHEAEFKPRSRCKVPASASSNWILILLTGFAQQLPLEKLALQPEWSFPVPKWSWHSQSPLPAFQRLPIARKIKTPRNPEAPWSNRSSFAQHTVRPKELKSQGLEQRKVHPGASLVAQQQRIHLQYKRCRCGFDPRVRKIPWRRAWQPTPVFLPGESSWTEEPGGP